MDDEWKWPDPPETPRDIIAAVSRNWGKQLAYAHAEDILAALESRGWYFCQAAQDTKKQG